MAKSKSTRGTAADGAPPIVRTLNVESPPTSNVVQLRLVPDAPSPVSRDTVEMLEEILHEARKGKVVGLAFSVLFADRTHVVGYTGECARMPTYARGMVLDLLDDLAHASSSQGAP